MKKMQAKLCSESGESIVETLVTMIILSLAVIMLSGAVVTSARVNEKADNTETAFTISQEQPTQTSVVIAPNGGTGTRGVYLDVNSYKTENGYTYYEPQ